MLFRATVFASFISSILANEVLIPRGGIRADSAAGQKLLSKARALEQDRDVTWVANYDIKYTGCSSLVQIREEGGGEEGLLYTQNLVKFSLCPSNGGCSSCSGGGEYVVSMMEFVDAYTEFKMNEQEQICENIRENCYCNDNGDEDACANQCYQNEGMDVCIEYEGDEEFEIQRYLECAEMEEANNNNNNGNYNYNNNNGNADNWYGQYFIGPYCSEKDGWSIHLGVFYDEGCSSRADSSVYANKHYGVSLPFSDEPIVQSECISCLQVDENNNNNNNNQNNNNQNNGNNYYYYQDLETNELCGEMYEQAARCEQNMDVQYQDNNACEYINRILPRLESATRKVSSSSASGSSSGGASVAFAWIFAITSVLFGAYAFFLYRKLSRNRVNLSGSDGALA